MIRSTVIVSCDHDACERSVHGTRRHEATQPRAPRPDDYLLTEPMWQAVTDPASHRDVTLCPSHRRRYGQDFPHEETGDPFARRSLTPPATMPVRRT